MSLASGARLGPYEIVSPLGAGGMGEVFRATDSRLNRTVAIKILSDESAADADRRERFEREAKAISALDHPNICALYDVGEHQGTYFLVMPCLEGQTLAERLAKGALPPDHAIKYAIEIATALDAAHRQGIIHRDLKPGNIMLTKTGVKLLDFGLAKLKKAAGPLTYSGMANLAGNTTQATGTGIGTLLGTMPYMAPEQVEGREVDARSDISLGAVIYEMVTGQRAFKGESPASVIGAILKDEPPSLTTLEPLTPAALDHVVSTCLAKDPDERWQSAADIARELKWIAQSGGDVVAGRGQTKRSGLWAAAVALLVVVAGLAATAWPALRPPPVPAHVVRFGVEPPRGYNFVGSISSISMLQFAVSPDGRHLVYVAARRGGQSMLRLRPLNEVTDRELAGTLGAADPFWSPDSQFVGFFADGRLKTIHIGTGELRDVCTVSRTPRGAAWGADGIIVFGADTGFGLYKVAVSTGAIALATDGAAQTNSHRWPAFLADGKRFLYYARGGPDDRGIYLGSVDGTAPVRILPSVFNGIAASGYLVTVRDGSLLAYPFDERSTRITGDPIQVADHLGGSSAQRAAFSLSSNGVLVHGGDTNEISRLTWFDRSGRETDPQVPPGNIATFRLSPDGGHVATTRVNTSLNTTDIWVTDLERSSSTRFTLDPANDLSPVWSRDGKQIVFRSDRNGTNVLFRKPSSGATEDEQIGTFSASNPTDWTTDGRHILFHQTVVKTSSDLGLASLDGTPPTYLVNTVFDEFDGRFSPNGRWLTYVSNESGRAEVYVQPFPITGSKWIVSLSGGSEPRWRGDGRELFYLAADGRMMSVSVDATATFRAGTPRALFQTRVPPTENPFRVAIDVTRDGQRFLIKTPLETAPPASLTVVANWLSDMTRR